jgi:thiosulfate/3-mercaptopyruvate sulfurtransferase
LRGISPARPVLVYEQDSGMRAARALWLLEYLGHPDVRLLDGGFTQWRRDGRPISTDPVAPTPSDWHGTPDPSRLATWQTFTIALGKPDTVIVDTRSAAEYYGDAVRAKRGGAIPGAVHLEWKENLTTSGAYKSDAELKDHVRRAGRDPGLAKSSPTARAAIARPTRTTR